MTASRCTTPRRKPRRGPITVVYGENTCRWASDAVWPDLVRLDVRRARSATGEPLTPAAEFPGLRAALTRVGWHVVVSSPAGAEESALW